MDGPVDVGATERLFGPEAIVGAAADAEILGFRAAAERVGDDVIELEERSRFAAVAVGGDVGAAASVALAVNSIRKRSGEIARTRAGVSRCGKRAARSISTSRLDFPRMASSSSS